MNTVKAAIAIFSILLTTSNALAENGKRSIGIELLAASSNDVDKLSATAFGISLANWANENGDFSSINSGIYKPTFNALMSAFSSQIQIWRELKEKEDPGSAYMDKLISVDNAGFLKEYIWVNHGNYIGGQAPTELRFNEYTDWANNNLSGHSPRIEARLNIE